MKQEEDRQFWATLLKEVECWQKLNLKENEQKVLDAVLTLMNNIEQIEKAIRKKTIRQLRQWIAELVPQNLTPKSQNRTFSC